MDTTWMGWSMALSSLFWVALLGVIIWGIVRFTNRRGSSATLASPLTAEELLRQRYVRGEIDAQMFETMREHLHADDSAHRLSVPHV